MPVKIPDKHSIKVVVPVEITVGEVVGRTLFDEVVPRVSLSLSTCSDPLLLVCTYSTHMNASFFISQSVLRHETTKSFIWLM